MLLIFLAACLSLATGTYINPCARNKGIAWMRDPTDCSVFFICYGTDPAKYDCPLGTVTDEKSMACVPKGSVLDTCKTEPIPEFQTTMRPTEAPKLTEAPKPTTEAPKKTEAPKPTEAPKKTEAPKPTEAPKKTETPKPTEVPKPTDVPIKQTQPPKPVTICDHSLKTRLPHMSSCAKFVDCSSGTPDTKECPYPLLFNDQSAECSILQEVHCGDRHEPKSPCEYESNLCKSSLCIPCHMRFPSCDGLPDGLNAWRGKEWSPHFVVCNKERVTYQGQCSFGGPLTLFDPVKRICIDKREH